MKKNLILLAIVATLLPNIALAASWWNPFSWFKDRPIETVQEEILENNENTDSEPVISTPAVQEKVVEKVITVSDPALQAQINNLIKENADLRSSLNSQSSIVQQLNQCKSDLIALKGSTSNTSASSEYQEKKEKLQNLDQETSTKISEMINEYKTASLSRLRNIRNETNELLVAYKFIDSKFNIKDVPDYLDFAGKTGSTMDLIDQARLDYKNAYQDLRKDLDWYIKYR